MNHSSATKSKYKGYGIRVVATILTSRRSAARRVDAEHDADWDKWKHMGFTLARVHKELALTHPNDTFHVYVRGHVACIREGVLEDWTALKPSRRKVTYIERIIDRTS